MKLNKTILLAALGLTMSAVGAFAGNDIDASKGPVTNHYDANGKFTGSEQVLIPVATPKPTPAFQTDPVLPQVNTHAQIKADATAYGQNLAYESRLPGRAERTSEDYGPRMAKQANSKGYHSPEDVDLFVKFASVAAQEEGGKIEADAKVRADKEAAEYAALNETQRVPSD